MAFSVATLPLENGAALGISPLPGRFSSGLVDMATLLKWRPDLVISATEPSELDRHNMSDLAALLEAAEVAWRGFPIRDFGVPEPQNHWPSLAGEVHAILNKGGRVLAHCYGGQGRSGMILLRLLIERGYEGEDALSRLRAIRPGAVETDAQFNWAINPSLFR